MARKVKVKRVMRLQEKYLRKLGATDEEIRAFRPLLTAQIGQESGFQTNLGSSAGARDIAQFMPGTAPGYGVTLGDNKIKDDIRGQVRYMLPLLRKYGEEDALRGYNAGVGAIEASKGYSETNHYVDAILSAAGRYKRSPGGPMPSGRPGRGGRPASSMPGMDPLSVTIGGDAGAGIGPLELVEALRGLRTKQTSPVEFAALLQGAQGAPGTKIELPGVEPFTSGGKRGSGAGNRVRVAAKLEHARGAKDVGAQLDKLASRKGWPIGSGVRSAEENARVGGSPTSDHLAGDGKWARDYPLPNQAAINKAGRRMARKLGIKQLDGGFTERVVTLGGRKYKVQIITEPHGTGPHLHVGVQEV